MKPHSNAPALLAIGALAISLLPSCFGHLTPAVASAHIDAPMLLGPVDHVGGGAALQTQPVREFESTSKHTFTHSDNGTITVDADMRESNVSQEAAYATRGDRQLDIRLTEIKPQAVGVWTGIKARVDLEGQVVRVKSAEGASK
ncbi:MAG TPA: hypothetical protein VGI10_15110 [Polyangiaceae bacterium]|jgi:hypothetical protein